MFKNNKTTLVLVIISFVASSFLSFNKGMQKKSENELTDKKKDTRGRFHFKSNNNHSDLLSHTLSRDNMTAFRQKILEKLTIDQLFQLWSEFSDLSKDPTVRYNAIKITQLHIMKKEILKKIGETAPLQGILFLENNSTEKENLNSLFAGWASKDPERALEYYKETYNSQSDEHAQDILGTIISKYAGHSPKKAWDWLKNHKENINDEAILSCQLKFISTISKSHPELMGTYLNDLGISNIEKLRESHIYALGLNWEKYDDEAKRQFDQAPLSVQDSIQAGRIMSLSNGDLDKVDQFLLEVPQERKREIVKKLAHSIFKAGESDLEKRVEWVMANLSIPDIKSSENFENGILLWMSEDRKDVKTWLDSMPPSDKKDYLKGIYDRKGMH